MCKERPIAPRSKLGICGGCRIRRKLDANTRAAERRKNGEVYSEIEARIIEAALASMDRRSWHGRFRDDRGVTNETT